ncbi:MAG TPA: SH3 domain-containing protein [Ktedonosporobacter sp.]|nr:SH3 domain-containing protein [Ktedonosporobacter sp.]
MNSKSTPNQTTKTCRVIKDHQAAYPDPLHMHAGETLLVSKKEYPWNDNPDWTFVWCTNQQGKSGWVPKKYIEQPGAQALYEYNCLELSVKVGEEVAGVQEECGWIWCTNQQGKSGWVPLENIECA